jgi:ferredoxin
MTGRVTISLEGHGAVSARTDERALVALERGQGFGSLKNMPRRLPVGCRRGGCGVCRMRVLNGEYRREPMSRAHVTDQDEAEGVVLACCVFPLSDLTLRLETRKARKLDENNV